MQNQPIWSRSEETIARTAFEAALGRELQALIQEAKKMVSQIKQSSDLRELGHYLTQRRKDIDRWYDDSVLATHARVCETFYVVPSVNNPGKRIITTRGDWLAGGEHLPDLAGFLKVQIRSVENEPANSPFGQISM